jgi:plastocyanin
MNKNTIIGVLLVVVLILLGFLIAGSKQTQAPTGTEQTDATAEESVGVTSSGSVSAPKSTVKTGTTVTTPAPAEEPVVVVYTGDRFTPSIAVITRGQKIIFLNQSDDKMWVTSDGSLPALNQGVAVSRGGTYSFIFNNTGKYIYLNKENPTRKGSVVVNYE